MYVLKTSCIHQNEVAFIKLVPTVVQVDTAFILQILTSSRQEYLSNTGSVERNVLRVQAIGKWQWSY